MSSTAYPISAPVNFEGTGAIYFANTGAIDFNNQTVTDFVSSATGATLYVSSGGALAALPIGTAGQYLQVNSGATAPQWVTLASEGPIFSAFSTATVAAVTGATAWDTLDNTVLTWDDASPGVSNAAFDPATGVFTASATGVYEFACSVVFAGNNSGNSVTLTNPSGRAARQVAIDLNAGTLVALASHQAEASRNNATQVAIYNAKIALVPSDTVSVAVRHDATTPLLIGGDARTSFSGSRVR